MLRTKLFTAAAVAALAMPALAWSQPADRAQWQADRQAIFAEADANHDGALSADEFATFHQLMRQHFAEKMFQRADANGDGVVTLAELEAAHGGRGPHGGGHCK